MILGVAQDFVILKDLVELLQLLLGAEEDFDDLVNREEGNAETEDDVGIKGDEGGKGWRSLSRFDNHNF